MAEALSKKLEHTGPNEKKVLLSVTKSAGGKDARAAFTKKKKKQSHLPRSPGREVGESEISESRNLAREREEDQSGCMGKKGWTLQ